MRIEHVRNILPGSLIYRLSTGNYVIERAIDFAYFDPDGRYIPADRITHDEIKETVRKLVRCDDPDDYVEGEWLS